MKKSIPWSLRQWKDDEDNSRIRDAKPIATSSWDLARSRHEHEFALLERRAVLERRFEVMERPAAETEEKRLYEDLGRPRT